MIEQIYDHEKLLSVIIRTEFQKDSIEFFTPDSFLSKLGMKGL